MHRVSFCAFFFFCCSVSFCAGCFRPATEEVTSALLSCKLAAGMPDCCVADDGCRHDATAAFVDEQMTAEVQDCVLGARCDDPPTAAQAEAMDRCLARLARPTPLAPCASDCVRDRAACGDDDGDGVCSVDDAAACNAAFDACRACD